MQYTHKLYSFITYTCIHRPHTHLRMKFNLNCIVHFSLKCIVKLLNSMYKLISIFRTLILFALTFQPVLCGTWILGLFFLITLIDGNSNPELSEALSWIFTIMNSLQVHYLYL